MRVWTPPGMQAISFTLAMSDAVEFRRTIQFFRCLRIVWFVVDPQRSDASHDIRTPTHELTIARDVLRIRRRIGAQPPDWALSADGFRSLRGQARPATLYGADSAVTGNGAEPDVEAAGRGGGESR